MSPSRVGSFVIAVMVVALLAAVLGADVPAVPGRPPASAGERTARWSEVTWPFPMDQWGTGRAFRCTAADCGSDVTVYVRPKIGFCNCTTGVADDEEMDRVGDVGLLSETYGPAGPGRAMPVGGLVGWTRDYVLGGSRDPAGTVLAVAFSDLCNVMVATVVDTVGITPAARARVQELLDSDTIQPWARATLGS
jgi:hypothetical protein